MNAKTNDFYKLYFATFCKLSPRALNKHWIHTNSLIFTIFAPIYSVMTKLTRDVSTCFVFKSSPEAFISPLFFKTSFTLEGGTQTSPNSWAMLPHIIWLALGFLPSYAPGYVKWNNQNGLVKLKFNQSIILSTISWITILIAVFDGTFYC